MTETHCCHAAVDHISVPALGGKLRIVGGMFLPGIAVQQILLLGMALNHFVTP